MLIDKVNKVVSDYVKSKLSSEFKIISALKFGDNWKVTAEVFEDSAFIQSIGLKTKAKDQNTYEFTLDENLEIIGFDKLK
jgi:hypothetical protein